MPPCNFVGPLLWCATWQGLHFAHIDSSIGFIRAAMSDYNGLLLENDLTEEAFPSRGEVRGWIEPRPMGSLPRESEPRVITTGKQCSAIPMSADFFAYCQSQEPQAEQPIKHWLPGAPEQSASAHIEAHGSEQNLRDLPDELLNEKQRRVKAVTLSGKPYFDQ
jgi:hypothetical protein